MVATIKMVIPTNQNDWHEMTAERVWVRPLDSGGYVVENNPLYAYGVSFGDTVEGKYVNGILLFSGILKRGGHSTYRILLRRGVLPDDFRRKFEEVEKIGCRYESSRDPEDVFSIDVPPYTDVSAVYSFLERGQEDGLWHLDEGNYEHDHANSE